MCIIACWANYEKFDEQEDIDPEEAIDRMVRIQIDALGKVKDSTCAICLADLSDWVLINPPCCHVFHEQCIAEWIQ